MSTIECSGNCFPERLIEFLAPRIASLRGGIAIEHTGNTFPRADDRIFQHRDDALASRRRDRAPGKRLPGAHDREIPRTNLVLGAGGAGDGRAKLGQPPRERPSLALGSTRSRYDGPVTHERAPADAQREAYVSRLRGAGALAGF
jgi:hypothetical protein